MGEKEDHTKKTLHELSVGVLCNLCTKYLQELCAQVNIYISSSKCHESVVDQVLRWWGDLEDVDHDKQDSEGEGGAQCHGVDGEDEDLEEGLSEGEDEGCDLASVLEETWQHLEKAVAGQQSSNLMPMPVCKM